MPVSPPIQPVISAPTRAANDRVVLLRKLEDRTLRVVVLAGGSGAEREVSLQSGRAVYEALRRAGFEPLLRDVGPADLSALDCGADFFFLALHGEFGEDGAVQRELERRGLLYSGSGAAASRLAMDKAATKQRVEALGLPTPSWRLVHTAEVASITSFPTPAVVKPVASGSSVDLTIARSAGALAAAAGKLVERYGQALVESYIRGRELTVGVLGDQALPVCEIRTKREFYDYQAKYVDGDTQYVFDIDLPDKLLRRVREMSLRVHNGLGCRVFSRMDWMVDGATLEPFFLEINTIPGFTSHSLVPKAAGRVGISFEQLCERIIALSLAEESFA
jgi:D-alanine-D-alanine ligase